jgi:HEAT repeat protein
MFDVSGFGWLHLTDRHVGGPDVLWPTIGDVFFQSIPRIHEWSGGRWDAIFFTGDLVFSGEAEQYEIFESFRQHLIEKVAELNGGTPPVFLAIPGNHDLERPRERSPIVYAAKAFEHDRGLRDDFWSEHEHDLRVGVGGCFEAWTAWSRNARPRGVREGKLPGDFSLSLETGSGLSVGVVGLNSTFLQLDGGDWKGHLALGVEQLLCVCEGDPSAWVGRHDVTFLLTHHPPDWLCLDRDDFSAEIAPPGRFDVHLFGHEHGGQTHFGSQNFAKPRVEILGRSLFGLAQRGPGLHPEERFHGYSAGRIRVTPSERASVRLWPRTAQKVGGGWQFVPDTRYFLPDDRSTSWLSLGDRPRRGAEPPRQPSQDRSGVGRSSRAPADALEDYYRRWLLGISDRLDLQRFFGHASLPTGSDTIPIDALYVTARVARELPSRDRVDASRGMRTGHEDFTVATGPASAGAILTSRFGLTPTSTADASSSPTTIDVGRMRTEHISFGKAVCNWRHIVLLGKAGAGKSTLVSWAATALLRRRDHNRRLLKGEETLLPDEEPLPIVVDLRNVTACPETLRDLILTIRGIKELSQPDQASLSDRLGDAWRRGTAVLFLDGLDEVGGYSDGVDTEKLRNDLSEWIANLGAGFQHARIVVTSRISGYSEVPARIPTFEHVKLADLTLKDKHEFASNWTQLFADPRERDAEAQKLFAGFVEHEQLTATPQLMTYMAALWQRNGAFPASRTELYSSLVELLCTTKPSAVPEGEWRPQLHYIAHSMCGGHSLDELHLATLREAISEDLNAADFAPIAGHAPGAFLRLMAQNASILEVRGSRRTTSGQKIPVYEFPHQTFVEFLAGRAIAAGQFPGGRNSGGPERVDRIVDDAILSSAGARVGELPLSEPWVGALRFAVEWSDQPTDLFEAILPPWSGRDRTEVRTRAILAALCMAGQPAVVDEAASAILAEFCASIDHRDGEGTQGPSSLDRTALELATSSWSRKLLQALCTEIKGRRAEEVAKVAGVCARVAAASAPTEERTEQFATWVRERVADLRSHDEYEVLSSCLALMELTYEGRIWQLPPELDEALFALLDGPSVTGFAAAWAMWWLIQQTVWRPSPDQVEAMMELLRREDTDQNVGQYLLAVAGAAHDQRALEFARRVLQGGDGPLVAAAIRVVDELRPEDALDLVQPLLANPQNLGIGEAARLLGSVGDERAVPSLVRVLRESPPGARRKAAAALGQIASAEAVDPLIDALEDWEAPGVRVASSQALGSIKDVRAIQVLTARATDRLEDPDVRSAAIGALGEIQPLDSASIDALVRLLEDDLQAVKGPAAWALGRSTDPRAREALLERVAAGRAELEQPAAESLAMAADDEVASLLRPIAGDEDPDIRATAALMAGVVLATRDGDTESVIGALVVGLLRDESEDVWRAALAALPNRYPIPSTELEWLTRADAGPIQSPALLLRLEAAIRKNDPSSVHERLAEAGIYALGHPAGDMSGPGAGTEADLLHFTVDDSDDEGKTVERILLPVFTRPEIMRDALLRNPEWQVLDVLEINGGELLRNVDDDVSVVVNPWSDLEWLD